MKSQKKNSKIFADWFLHELFSNPCFYRCMNWWKIIDMKFEPDLKVATIRESKNFKMKYKSYNDFKIKFKEEKKDVIFSNIFSCAIFSFFFSVTCKFLSVEISTLHMMFLFSVFLFIAFMAAFAVLSITWTLGVVETINDDEWGYLYAK